MASHRIVCTEQEPASNPPKHAHIVAVGIGTDPNNATSRMTLGEVITAMDRGESFFTFGEQSKKTAKVEKYWCPHCSRNHIRSTADAVQDNNLDNLQYCNWKK
jgi:hypothetical protein